MHIEIITDWSDQEFKLRKRIVINHVPIIDIHLESLMDHWNSRRDIDYKDTVVKAIMEKLQSIFYGKMEDEGLYD